MKIFLVAFASRYLLEDQIRGPSSVEAYIRAIRAGCRCVESKSVLIIVEMDPVGSRRVGYQSES